MFGTIQPDHPAGKSLCGNQPPIVACLPPFAKYFASRFTQIISTSAPVPSHRGALRNVINAGRDAVDAGGAQDDKRIAGDGNKRARSPGRARRKPLKPLRGECRLFSGVTVVTTLACLFYFTCEAAGASSTRHSLRPPNGGLKEISGKPRAQRAARTRSCVCCSLTIESACAA